MYLALDTKFNPFSYAEMVQPLLYYKDAYEKTEAAYSDLASQTEAWKDIANQQNSPEAYAMYKRYSADLNRVVEDFNGGMTAGNRKQLLNMKRRYAKEIAPIERASAALDEAIKYRQETTSKDQTAVFVKNYSSIDDFLHGKRANNEFVSGKDLMTRVAAKAEGMGKALFSDPQFKKILGGQKYQAMIANGYTPEMLLQVLQNDPDASPYLTQIYKEELDSIGLDRFSELDKAKLINSAKTGMYAGLQKPTVQFFENGEYIDAAQRDASARGWAGIRLQQQELNERKQERQNKEAMASGQKPFAVDPDGTQHFTNGASYWTVTPNKPVTVKTNKGDRYEYTDPRTSKKYYGTTPNGYKLPDGTLLTAKDITSRSSGKISDLQPVSKGGIAAEKKTENENKPPKGNFPKAYWHADNDKASNINSISTGTAKTRFDAEKIVEPSSLSAKHQEAIKASLVGTGYSLKDVQVGIIRHTFKDDEYFLVPRVDTDTPSNSVNSNSVNSNDEDSPAWG